MENKDIFKHVDHTLLSPTATWPQIQALCDEAVQYGAASVCVPPCYVGRIREAYGPSLTICTVIGFPLGYASLEAKVAETEAAVAHGAGEVDMVVNICDAKNGAYADVTREITAVKKAAAGRILKVIVETCYFSEPEKIALCRCVSDGGADYIKTSTGFGTGGATLEDIRLFKAHIDENVKIKASGGIRTREDMERFIAEGCARIGASSGVKALFANQ